MFCPGNQNQLWRFGESEFREFLCRCALPFGVQTFATTTDVMTWSEPWISPFNRPAFRAYPFTFRESINMGKSPLSKELCWYARGENIPLPALNQKVSRFFQCFWCSSLQLHSRPTLNPRDGDGDRERERFTPSFWQNSDDGTPSCTSVSTWSTWSRCAMEDIDLIQRNDVKTVGTYALSQYFAWHGAHYARNILHV